MKIFDYHRQIYMEGAPLGDNCCGFLLDTQSDDGDGDDMAKHVGLPSCNRCDYFVFEKEAVALIEIKNLSGAKESIRKKYKYIPWDKDADGEIAKNLFKKHIAESCVLKLYGSMVVLCWFANCCEVAAKNLCMRRGKYKFLLVMEYADHDVRVLENMRLSLQEELGNRIKGVASGFVAEVLILNRRLLKKKIEDDAVPPT